MCGKGTGVTRLLINKERRVLDNRLGVLECTLECTLTYTDSYVGLLSIEKTLLSTHQSLFSRG